MKVTVILNTKCEPFFKTLKEAGINIRNEENRYIANLKNALEIDIFVAYLSRYFFTNRFHLFVKKKNITPTAVNYLKRDFEGLIYIRKKIINYLRNGNTIISANNFFKYNLADLENIFNKSLVKINSEIIKNEISNLFIDSERKQIKNMIISFTYAFAPDNFFCVIKSSNNSIIGEFNQDNVDTLLFEMKKNNIQTIKIAGMYQKDVINMIYTNLLEWGYFNVNFIVPKEAL